MISPQLLAGAAALCAAMLAPFAVSAEVRPNQRVSVASCPYPGATSNCLLIKATDGTVYNISSVTPRPRASGRVIRFRGTVTDKMSACGDGVVLDRIRWTRTRQRCSD